MKTLRIVVKVITGIGTGVAVALAILAVANAPKEMHFVEPPSLAQTYMESGDCWNGGTGHPIPSQAIVETRKGTEIVTGKGVAAAIDQVFGHGKPFVRIYGFCA